MTLVLLILSTFSACSRAKFFTPTNKMDDADDILSCIDRIHSKYSVKSRKIINKNSYNVSKNNLENQKFDVKPQVQKKRSEPPPIPFKQNSDYNIYQNPKETKKTTTLSTSSSSNFTRNDSTSTSSLRRKAPPPPPTRQDSSNSTTRSNSPNSKFRIAPPKPAYPVKTAKKLEINKIETCSSSSGHSSTTNDMASVKHYTRFKFEPIDQLPFPEKYDKNLKKTRISVFQQLYNEQAIVNL